MKDTGLHTARSFNQSELLRELSAMLRNVETSVHANSLEEGDTYICSTCDLAVKICAGNPTAICLLKVRQNTELDLVRNALREWTAGTYGRCMACGKRITSQQLKLNPLQELCPACRSRTSKKRRTVREE